MTKRRPAFRELSRDESEKVLARNHVGRIAFTFHDHVDIEPIHYVYEQGWIYGRTSPGAKLATIAHHRWVAFEVDEIRDHFDWQSVVVKGAFYMLDADDPSAEFVHGAGLLRGLVPESFTATDPAAFRGAVFRIPLDQVTGRAASTT